MNVAQRGGRSVRLSPRGVCRARTLRRRAQAPGRTGGSPAAAAMAAAGMA